MINENDPHLASALERVADTITSSLNASAKADERRWRLFLLFFSIGGPLLLALIISLTLQQKAIRDNEHLMKRGISCLLADLDDHRHTNQYAHNTLTEGLHLPEILQPDVIPLTPQQATELKKNCDSFVQAAIGLGYGNFNSNAGEITRK